MKSYIIKCHSWIYLLYSTLILAIVIDGIIKWEIDTAIWCLILFFIPLLIIYLIKRKTYIKFSNKKVYVNLQEKRYSLKMKESEIDIDNMESIEICKITSRRIWFLVIWMAYWSRNMGSIEVLWASLMYFLVLILPLIIRRNLHRKFIIHQKTWKIIHLRITPIWYDNTVNLFLQQYAKEKSFKIINPQEKKWNWEWQDINMNDLFQSIITSSFIDIERTNDRTKNTDNNNVEENTEVLPDVIQNNTEIQKWYMLCPFCANEIKKWAIKCQYCKEFINTKKTNNKWFYDKII